MDTKYSKESLGEVAEDLRGELDSAEIDLLLATIFRLALEQQDLTIMTYGEILEDGKEWKEEQRQRDAEQKALQEEAMRKEEEAHPEPARQRHGDLLQERGWGGQLP